MRNEQTEESDVDIAYEGEANLLLRSRMKQELESLFGCRVDIIRLRKQLVDSVFGQNIENDLFMFDKVRIGSLLDRIENSILLIQSKSGEINCPDDFLLSQDGMFILSGICMQLVFIGESVKTIDNKTNHSYLIKYTDIPWTAIMGLGIL